MSRRRFLGAVGMAAVAGTVVGCGDDEGDDPTATAAPPDDTPTTAPTAAATATSSAPAATPTERTGPSLEVMVGQMLLLGFRGTELTDDNPIVADLEERHIGGVVLFDYDVEMDEAGRNIRSPEQLRDLTASLHRTAPRQPLLVSVDQEGGLVQRLGPDHGFPDMPSAEEVGASGDPAYAREVASQAGALLAEYGINLNFAPVVDVNTNPENPVIGAIERSYSADAAEVADLAMATIEGYHEHGILTALKHFPGHGSSTEDSHEGFVDVTGTWGELELEPYRTIIEAGLADSVMSAHVFNAELDPELPATLSEAVITGLLRDELGFGGVTITDDLQMGAIADEYGFEEALRLSIEAGNDILAIANNLTFEANVGERAHGIVMELVESGTVSEARIRQSYDRILAFKRRFAR